MLEKVHGCIKAGLGRDRLLVLEAEAVDEFHSLVQNNAFHWGFTEAEISQMSQWESPLLSPVCSVIENDSPLSPIVSHSNQIYGQAESAAELRKVPGFTNQLWIVYYYGSVMVVKGPLYRFVLYFNQWNVNLRMWCKVYGNYWTIYFAPFNE